MDSPVEGSEGYTKELLVRVSAKLRRLYPEPIKQRTLPKESRRQRESKMTRQLCFIDGTFAELTQEMADFVGMGEEVKPLIEQDKRDDVLQTIVKASSVLNSVSEKEFTGAYNLLIHLVLQSPEPKKYLPTMCSNLLKPITASATNSYILGSNALCAIFNQLAPDNPLRYNVFMQIIRFTRQYREYFDNLKANLDDLELWFEEWDVDDSDQRRMYMEIFEIALEAGAENDAYRYLVKALASFDKEDKNETTSDEAQALSLRAVKAAITSPTRFDFSDLRVMRSVQALADSHPLYSQLLDIFAERDLEDYLAFKEEHKGWIEQEKMDDERLQTKMRLLTLPSLAAANNEREIRYDDIAKALQIPVKDVERWTIDVIRAGLVEGKLSQQRKVFLVHRTTYRVFGEKQWRELASRIDNWKVIIDTVLYNLEEGEAEVKAQRERDQQEVDRKLAHAGLGVSQGDRRRGGGPQQRQRTDDDD